MNQEGPAFGKSLWNMCQEIGNRSSSLNIWIYTIGYCNVRAWIFVCRRHNYAMNLINELELNCFIYII